MKTLRTKITGHKLGSINEQLIETGGFGYIITVSASVEPLGVISYSKSAIVFLTQAGLQAFLRNGTHHVISHWLMEQINYVKPVYI